MRVDNRSGDALPSDAKSFSEYESEECEGSVIEEEGGSTVLTLPSRRFHRHQGLYTDHYFTPEGDLITQEEFERRQDEWLLRPEDNDYLHSIMKPCYAPGKFANWIAPPARGIEGKPEEFEYVRL